MKTWGVSEYMKNRWEALNDAAQACTSCALYSNSTQKIISDPPEWVGTRSIIFIGEAPGVDEDKTGLPFTGKSGQKLREQIDSIGLPRSLYAIIDVVQCRTPKHRVPQPMEVQAAYRN